MNLPDSEHLLNTAKLLARENRLDEAAAMCRRALALRPEHAPAWAQLGFVALQAGQYSAARQALERAIALDPTVALWHGGLGLAWAMTGNLPQAIGAYRTALSLNPGDADIHYNLGHALHGSGQRDEAIGPYRNALELRPHFVEAMSNLGNLLWESGQLDAAIDQYRQALALRPAHATALLGLGNALRDKGQTNDAIAAYERGAALAPNLPEAHYNLGSALQSAGQRDRAMAAFGRALSLRPDYASALNHLASLHLEEAELDRAIACYRAAAAGGQSVSAHNNLIYAMHFHPSCGMGDIALEQRRWKGFYAAPFAAMRRSHVNDRSPDRALRIGCISAHFRNHPVGRFMTPLLQHHDRTNFGIVCYSDLEKEDETTRQLRGFASEWKPTRTLSDQQLAEQVRADRIDVLVDLTLHMDGCRLLTFVAEPAPVQVTYLAYCSTSGLDSMQYRLTDPFLDPAELPTPFYSERSVHLPRTYWCYPPPEQTPAVDALPALANGHVTFGCLNNYFKVSPPVWAAWHEILRAVPASRLMLFCPDGAHRQRIIARFAAAGLDPNRLKLVSRTLPADYFKRYLEIDIALDTFPYGGGTTTCDALWMGVPVVTLAGDIAVSRGGKSILSNLRLPELIGATPQEYVRIATGLAGDVPRLSRLRATLRGRMLDSPLTDGASFARDVESAFRTMWHQFVRTHPRP